MKSSEEWARILDEISKGMDSIREEMISEQNKTAAEMDYKTKMNIVAWVFRKIVEHAREGGSYRYLIYDRLGFEPDAYAVLYEAGGMEISNNFDLMDHE